MSYVIVENDPLDETTQFTVCEAENSNVATSARTPERRRSVGVRGLSREDLSSKDNGTCSEILQIQPTFELIEISPDCVEYMGKLMCGEIVEATVLSFKDESLLDNTDEFARTPEHYQPITTLESTEKCMPIIFDSKPSNTSLYIRVLRNIYETHIHICECIAVCSCCSTA